MNQVVATKSAVLTNDLLALRHIDPADLAKERVLAHQCWWEYRSIHPTQRTLMFSHAYESTYKRFTGKYVDHARESYVSGVRGDSRQLFPRVLDDEQTAMTRRRNLVGFWRARQAADELQISYEVYLRACFELASANGWAYFPRPTHLYSDRMKTAALDAQVKELEGRIPQFTNPGLMAGATAPFKQEFDQWLFDFMLLRKVNRDLAIKRLATLGYITQEQVEDWIGRAAA